MNDHLFFVLLGLASLTGALLYGYHLWQVRDVPMPNEQAWRFIALFLGACAILYGSYEQIEQAVDIEPRHLWQAAFALALMIAAVKSIRAENRKMRRS